MYECVFQVLTNCIVKLYVDCTSADLRGAPCCVQTHLGGELKWIVTNKNTTCVADKAKIGCYEVRNQPSSKTRSTLQELSPLKCFVRSFLNETN